jgi:FkbM family methyltransferase
VRLRLRDIAVRIVRGFRQPLPDVATASLPPGAARKHFRMSRESGRDQVGRMIDGDGWLSFEPPMPLIFFQLARRARGLVIDIGANTGFYAFIAAAASRQSRVIAFEPEQGSLDILRRNIKLNRFGWRIRVVPLALSNRTGQSKLYIPARTHGLVETSSSLESSFKPAHSDVVSISTTTLDAFLSGILLRWRRVGLIKLDVEGHETSVLEGCARTVARHRPVVFIEVLRNADFGALDAFLRTHAYADVPLLPNVPICEEATVQFFDASSNHAFVPREGLENFKLQVQ